MPLSPGDPAPDFSLPGEAGTRARDDVAADGRVLLAFYKGSCPTCQLAFPVFGALEAAYGDAVPFVAVAQDALPEARAWLDDRGFTGPVLDDCAGGYTASADYDLDSVPSLYLIEDGRVVHFGEGWDVDDVRSLNTRLAALAGRDPIDLDLAGLPVFKPG